MMKKLLTALFVVLSLSIVEAQKIVGYLPSYRDPSTTNIQYAKVNTILYAFINPDATGNLITTTGQGSSWDFSMTHFLTVKSNCTTYGTKLYISCGGADAGNQRSSRLDAVCGNATYRATLVSQLVQFALTHNLAGIDIDWEFPTTASARTNHEALLADLRIAVNASSNPAIRIGVAVGGEYSGGINHLNYFNANAVQYVDDFHLMTYDFPVSYNTNHATLADAQASFNQWNSAKGVPKSKMYMGVPFYGRDASHNSTSDYRNFSVGAASYNVDTYGGYYYNGKTTLETKASWVVAQGGQGIMIWDLGQDRTLANGYTLLDVIYNQMATICPAPQPDLGPDVGFCSGSTPLSSNVATQAGRTFTWKLNGTAFITNSASANTYSATAGGTYIVEVNQGGCTKSDQIVVTSGSSLGVTNAVSCGPGSVTISVNASSGTYDWYTASTGGSPIYTGINYTFNETASNTYYVQQNTGSVSYSGGKTVINVPTANNEAGYESTNSLPRFAHKIVVSQTLTIQNVKIWTSNNATTGVKVMVMSSVDGTTVQQQTTPVNLTAGGSPYTLTTNLTLTPGTYYIGVYAPVSGYPGNGIWSDPTPYASSQSGVYSIGAAAYANYGTGFNATGQALNTYGQLFDWTITTGIVPPCGRTAVTTTINAAATTTLSVSGTTPICSGVDGTVTIQGSETNVSYQPYIGANTAGAAVYGNGGALNLTVDNPNLVVGTNTITVKGTKTGCGTVNLTNTATIVVSSASSATITFGNVNKTYGNAAFNLSASSASSGAFTYSLVSSTPASIVTVASNGLVTMTGAGSATVKVDQAASGCYSAGSATATLTINKAALTATADNQSRNYGAANPAFTFTYSGFVNSETSSVIDAVPTASTTATATSNVGTYTITAAGGTDNNYTISLVNGTLTVNKATLTATANNQSRTYGAANPTFTFTYTGFVNGETSSVIDVVPTASTAATATSNVGTYTITAAGGTDNNYSISLTNGTLTITKATVTATADNQSRIYGVANPSFTFTYSGFVNGETSSVIDAAPTASTTATVSSNVGTYTITAAGGSDNNYNITLANGTLTITKANRSVTITSSSTGTAGGSISLTYTTTPSGGVATWTETNGTGTATVSSSTLSLLTVGTVTVQVDIAADVNYNAASNTQTVTISNLATPTITFNGATKVYGDVPFTMTATSNSAGAFTYSLVSSVPAGIITVGSNGLITITGAGTATVKVDQAANSGFGPGSASATVTIGKANRTVSVTSTNSGLTGNTISLTNTVSAGTGAVTWSVTNGTGAATLNTTTLSLVVAGTVTVQVDIAADANYNATSATQTVTITAGGSQTPQPGAFTTSSPNVTQGQTGVTYTIPNVPGTTYTWTYSGTGGTITGTGNSITIDFGPTATSGTLSVVANDGSGNSIPRDLAINVAATTTAVTEALVNTGFKVYPNPFESSSIVYFELQNSDQVKLEVFDLVGHKVETLINGSEFASGSYEISLSNIPMGVYMVKLQIGSREQNIKIVKN
jgi:GH18 family chitinase